LRIAVGGNRLLWNRIVEVPDNVLAAPRTLRILRGMLLAIVFIALVGTAIELVLLGHYEDRWQWTPLVLIAVSLLALVWRVCALYSQRTDPWAVGVRGFQAAMLGLIAAGAVGVWLHYDSNVEFELEMYPSMAGWRLMWESLTGAIPALAPGSLVHIGLLGLAATYRDRPEREKP
jgi:hypothetical protein